MWLLTTHIAPHDLRNNTVTPAPEVTRAEREEKIMLTKYKGWNIEKNGHGYTLTRIEKVDGRIIEKRAKTQEHAKTVITNAETMIAHEAAAKAKAERERVITKRFRADLNDHKPVVFTFQRFPSAMFAYGNQTSVSMHEGDTFLGIIDTRYDNSVLADFTAWCIDYLKSYIDPKYEPKFTEIE